MVKRERKSSDSFILRDFHSLGGFIARVHHLLTIFCLNTQNETHV